MKKQTLLERLLQEGWFATEKEAASWVMMRRVLIDGQIITGLKEKVSSDGEIRIKEYYKRKYVNKGGLKLESALDSFKVDVKGKVALDCGASTGGFTDCLLQHGAARVYAVDVGFGQLAGKLRQNPAVVNMEKTNLGDEVLRTLEPAPEVISLDLSYLSLKKGVPLCKNILKDGTGIVICLVKPLFEVESADTRRTGTIGGPEVYKEILEDLCGFFLKENFQIMGVSNSSVTGNAGTLEYFIALRLGEDKEGPASLETDLTQQINMAVECAMKLERFEKT